MTDKPKDGGSAFPARWRTEGEDGMSLRDYFAAAAMQGMLSSEPSSPKYSFAEGGSVADRIAEEAYFMADAMLKEREEGDA